MLVAKKKAWVDSLRCQGLAPWSFTLVTKKSLGDSLRCHGLAPWWLTLVAKKSLGGLSQMPRIAPWSFTLSRQVEAISCSCERESPRHKAVASVRVFHKSH